MSTKTKDKKFLVKFENVSNRVKGLAFHCKRPWILASLHNGIIQLWDYRMETMIDTFEEHDGPVRGINFHTSQSLFVSGGDDYKIKVWNYSLRRCLFNLLGHLDYIRTVQFHHEYPWILSSSDDQTIRIWNWQSRNQLSVLTGHNHYVMCAQFHPKDDTILSASLDQTVRVWDFSGLRKKSVSISSDFINTGANNLAGNQNGQNGADYFGGSDVTVKHVLEGHARGVNWASFHRSMPLIVSGADDREVKLWRYNDSKAWEVDTMRGHLNNVSCVLFHPKKELIVSNSEDKTIRVWDISKIQHPQVQRRDADRYWILEAHPNLNLMAAGHDSGLLVFKLARERPAYDPGKRLMYYKDLFIYDYDLKTEKEKPILTTRRRGANPPPPPRSLLYNQFNQTQHCILLCSDSENEKDKDDGTYELYVFPKGEANRDDSQQALRGFGKSACFVSRNRFAVLDKTKQIWLKSLTNETKRKINVNNVSPLAIWPGGIGRLLLRTSEGMILYDIQALKVVGELKITNRYPVKYVVWSPDHQYVAMFSKANIYVANGARFEEECTISENSRIKSGGWDPCGVFVYTTATHIKYLVPNGDNGIIRTLDTPIYITSVSSQWVTYLDRETKTGKLAIDATEYLFKVALMKRKYKDVLRIMKSKKLVGQSIIAYLQKKGHPEVALHFVQDETIKFSLALECGNIVVALECAKKLDNNDCWHKLGVEALRQGNHEVVEFAYQRTKNFERLSFLYLITGNIEKLSKMLKIASLRDDMMGRFHNSLFLGDVTERVHVLKDAGQVRLAYLTAKVHGLAEEEQKLEALLGDKVPRNIPADMIDTAALLFPPNPILKQSNWPLLEVRKSFPDGDMPDDKEDEKKDAKPIGADENRALDGDEDDDGPGAGKSGGGVDISGWGPDGDIGGIGGGAKKPEAKAGGWNPDDLDIALPSDGDKEDGSTGASAAGKDGKDGDYFLFPSEGKSAAFKWANNSPLAADMIAAGSFDLACGLLHRQIGVVNFAPLKPYFMAIYSSAHGALPQMASTEPLNIPTLRAAAADAKGDEASLPELVYKLSNCVDTLKNGYLAVTEGKFGDAVGFFTKILHTIPVLVVDKKAQVAEVAELLEICREYILAMRLEMTRKEEKDVTRQASLAAYFTRCKIQPMHLVLGLRVAIKSAYSAKNLKTCAGLCQRVLELCLTNNKSNLSKAVDVTQIKNVLRACEKTPTDATDMKYSDTEAFVICAETFTPIGKNQPSAKCPYCQASYRAAAAGSLCRICQLSKIDSEATGLRCFPN